MCKLENYKDASELWSKLTKFYENPSLAQNEDELEKEDSLAKELEESERCSIIEIEEEEETSTSRIEGEHRSKTQEQEEPPTSRAFEEEDRATSTSMENLIHEGKTSSIHKNKDDIICYECREKGHYNSRCPKLTKKKVRVASRAKEIPKEARTLICKSKEHIMYFSCNKNGHYQNQYPRASK